MGIRAIYKQVILLMVPTLCVANPLPSFDVVNRQLSIPVVQVEGVLYSVNVILNNDGTYTIKDPKEVVCNRTDFSPVSESRIKELQGCEVLKW
jgi:hypothetical protein